MSQTLTLFYQGRRSKVSTTPTTTLAQLLQQFCSTNSLLTEHHYFTYNGKPLDMTLSMRLANLAPGATLEIEKYTESAIKAASEKLVKVALQTVSGERLIKEFAAKTTLWEVIEYWKTNKQLPTDDIILSTPEKQIGGEETLKCLKISEISHGASSLLFRIKYGQISNQTNLTGSQTQSIKIEAKPILAPVRPKEEDEDTVKVQKPLKDLKQSDQDNTSKAEPAPPTIEVDQQPTTLKTSQTPQETNTKPESTTKGAIQVKIEDVTAKRPSDEPNETGKRMKIEPNLTKVISETPKMRQKVNLEDLPRELPDDFYEMTIEDIQMLISSAKQRQERENRLMTLEMREKERNELLKNFERVSIRVRLPGGLSMQGVFGLRDTVRHISDAVYDCLLPSSPSFELFVTPPRQVLKDTDVLLDKGLYPSAIVYLSWKDKSAPNDVREYLKDKYKEYVTRTKSTLFTHPLIEFEERLTDSAEQSN